VARHLIVTADDFGASTGVNRGIVEAHRHGIVTSASLMVNRAAAAEAAGLAREIPELSVGLHFEAPESLDAGDGEAVRSELDRQLASFGALLDRDPTHLDAHHHFHREASEGFIEAADELRIPLRGFSPVAYIGGFYAQWEWLVTELHYVSVEFLQQILRTEVTAEWTELGTHPGYVSDDFESEYLSERETGVQTLTDPRVRETLQELGIELASFADYSRAAG
jgi:chitin disaccharide deacetylase